MKRMEISRDQLVTAITRIHLYLMDKQYEKAEQAAHWVVSIIEEPLYIGVKEDESISNK